MGRFQIHSECVRELGHSRGLRSSSEEIELPQEQDSTVVTDVVNSKISQKVRIVDVPTPWKFSLEFPDHGPDRARAKSFSSKILKKKITLGYTQYNIEWTAQNNLLRVAVKPGR